MDTETGNYKQIPGLELVGRGIYLRPYHPYELKDILFKRENYRTHYSKETDETYLLPDGYAVNESPPLPENQALNKLVIEESFERFNKTTGLDMSLTASNAVFSIDASASQTKHLRTEEDAYYALRTSFIPLWTLYLPNAARIDEKIFDIEVPVPFSHANRKVYERFFERFGSHFVKRAWIGGKAMLAFTVYKSSQMSKEDIQAGIKASITAIGDTKMDASVQKNKEKLQNNSDCTVFGKGGDELKLAALSSLDEKLYNEWLETINSNPQAIELEVAGIWTIIPDPDKAAALMEAYKVATTFTPISGIFETNRDVYFMRGENYFVYHIEKAVTEKPKLLVDKWPFLAKCRFERIDAALRGDNLISENDESLNRKLFLFRRNRYIRLDLDKNTIDEGYPKSIEEGWPGITFERIDATLSNGYDKLYFFCGSQYIRYDMNTHRADEGYPELIKRGWTGVTFDRIDAALYWGNAKAYFFRDDQHIRYDMVTYRADPGYPKTIIGSYIEDWKFFV